MEKKMRPLSVNGTFLDVLKASASHANKKTKKKAKKKAKR
jgi:hypothetical protein